MTHRRVLTLQDLPVLLEGRRAPVWWAMMVLVAIETTVFATLISSYFYLRFMVPDWPPMNLPLPDLPLPIINTGVLVTSSFFIFLANRSVARGEMRKLKIYLCVGVVMEIVFFIIKIIMSGGSGFDWGTHAYGSIFFTINWLHTAHVGVAIIIGCVATTLALRDFFTAENRLGIQALNIYFQFVAVIWLPVFVVLFLVPRWS